MREPTDTHRDEPGPGQATGILIALIGIQLVLLVIAYDLGFRYESGDPGATGTFTALSYGIAIFALLRWKRLTLSQVMHPSPHSVGTLLMVLLAPLAMCAAGAVVWMSDLAATIEGAKPVSSPVRVTIPAIGNSTSIRTSGRT